MATEGAIWFDSGVELSDRSLGNASASASASSELHLHLHLNFFLRHKYRLTDQPEGWATGTGWFRFRFLSTKIQNMKLVIIFGPSAVGKMTVGQELAKLIDLKLFHNHTSIEWVLQFFDFDEPGFKYLNNLLRTETFKTIAESDLKGLIFTFVWALGLPEEEEYVDELVKIFEDQGAEVFFVELEASLDNRLKRNKHEHRLLHKPSKRDLKRSEEVFLHFEENYRFNTEEGEFKRPNYLKINNDELSPESVAKKIQAHFNL